MATPPAQVYVHGYSYENQLWYCIDTEKLNCISDGLSPVAEMELKSGGGWALMDGHIYWCSGITKSVFGDVRPSRKLYRHNITSPKPKSWECVSRSKELQQEEACVLTLGRTIYFLGSIHKGDDYQGRHCGEAYNIDTKSWKLLALNLQDFAPIFSGRTTAVMKEEGDATVVCYSPEANLLFYKLNLDGFKVEIHPNFNLNLSDCNSLPNSGDSDLVLDDSDLHILVYAITQGRALASSSTLYWFTNDLHYLYGYDFSKEKWFRSTSLKQDLWKKWFCLQRERGIHSVSPVLVELSSTSFVVIALLSSGKLGVASLSVYKTTDTLDVSVGACQTISVDPYFYPLDGMAM